jgi:hypothetical protein
MIDAAPSNELVFAVAFRHAEQRTLTVVLLNASGSQQQIAIEGPGLPASFDVYRTTASESCQAHGSLASGSALTMPDRSLVTLYGADYEPTAALRRQAIRRQLRTPVAASVHAYDLRGRRLAVRSAKHLAQATNLTVLHTPLAGAALQLTSPRP